MLTRSDEVFITSTAGGIMPVSTIDGITISNGRPGPVTIQIKTLYWEMHRHPDWATSVAFFEND